MAGRFSVEAVFKAVDKVTAPVRRIQNNIGKMSRRISRGMRKVDRAVNRTLGKLKNLAGGILRAGTVAIGAIAALSITALK